MKESPFAKGRFSSRFHTTLFCLAVSALSARADWPNDHPTKYFQPPDPTPNGYNVEAGTAVVAGGAAQPIILADDFPCTQTGPITDIHIWASWLGDTAALNLQLSPITLTIWSDVPATPANGPSHPGVPLWSQTFLPGGALPGHYKVLPKGFAPSPFWTPDPPPGGNFLGNDSILWQYNFYADPQNEFVQQGTAAAPTNYWLSVTAGTNTGAFGWRVSAVHYNDYAVFGHLDPTGTTPLGDWLPMVDPKIPTKSLDLAFAITTTPQTPPPPTQTNKWVQYPDLQSGFGLDVDATVPNPANGLLTLADDFQCTMIGQITNIQFWGSFNQDLQPGGNTFVVSIWSDGPRTATGFSRPLQRLWTQTYIPGQYTVTSAGQGTEHFYNPETGLLAPETNVWLYSFDLSPTNSFCQQGQGTIYWVSISSISPAAAFLQWGWKTSTNHWGDVGVYGRVDPISGAVLIPWKPIFNPTEPSAVPLPVDFAFKINSGPPGPDCDPALGADSIQPPDTSTNGLDVWALQPSTVGDDFPCRITGPISGITVWGSWLNDLVDTNAQFQVNLWTDVPGGSPATGLPYSHPGQLVCSSIFYPPQMLGDVQRYQYRLYRTNVQEKFFNPLATPSLVGADTQIWRYDFFPFVPSCYFQNGGPFANNRIYWITVSYLGTPGTANNTVFGWKTSTRHFQDAAVYGTNGVNWNPLADPRNNSPLDLAKIVWKFPVTGINKDIFNLTTNAADGIQIVLSGPHLITWHYDDSPPWAFTSFIDGTNTVLQWSGRTIPVGGLTHVGYETPGSILPTMLSMNWLSGTNILGPVVQGNWHLLGDPFVIFGNDFFTGPITLNGGTIEFYDTPPPLDQMINGGNRSPLAVQDLQAAGGQIMPGGVGVMLNPQPLPPKVKYALIIIVLNGGSGPGAKDFVLVPLDQALVPAVQSLGFAGNGDVLLHIESEIGRMYQLQVSGDLLNPNWNNMGDPVMATGNDTILTAPMSGDKNFYRILLMP